MQTLEGRIKTALGSLVFENIVLQHQLDELRAVIESTKKGEGGDAEEEKRSRDDATDRR